MMPKSLKIRKMDEILNELRQHSIPVWVVATLAAIQHELERAILPAALRAAEDDPQIRGRLERAMQNLCVVDE